MLAAKRYRDIDAIATPIATPATWRAGRYGAAATSGQWPRAARYGRQVLAGQWATAEFSALCELWSLGVPVPYPVQVDGIEILMEFIGQGHTPRPGWPRSGRGGAARRLLAQIANAMRALAANGQAQGDLSAYNLLVDAGRVVLIDLPQVVDVVSNPNGIKSCAATAATSTP